MGELIKILDFVDDKWTVSTDQIPDGDEDQAGKPLSIITSIGQFGIGKSFLQNILLGAVKKGESFFEEETELLEVFPLETSIKSETKGIDMFNKYLNNPYNNKDMVLSLWDAEGPSNPNQSHGHDVTVFALSAACSQVLIFNVKEKLTSENMDKIQVFKEQMRGQSSGKKDKFQTLIIVVRDADSQFGYNWKGGEDYMEYMKREGGDQSQTATFFREIEETFSSVLVFMMPQPNQEVRTKSIKVTYMRDIDKLFRDSMRIFAQELFKQVIQPGMVSGKVFRVCDLKLQLTDIEKQLESGEKLTITTLANSMKAKIIQEKANHCSKKYQLELKKIWGEFQVKATRIQRHTELKNKTLEMFRTSMSAHYLEKQLETAVVTTLEELLDDTFKAYNDGCSKNQKWIIGGVIIGVAAFALIVYYYPAARPIILTATLACLAGSVIMKGWDIVKRYCDPNSSKTAINELVNMYTSPIKGLQAS